jgi:hypothetical protein
MDYYIYKYFSKDRIKEMFGTDDVSEVDHFSDEYFAAVGYVLALREEELNLMCGAVKKAISELFSKKR